MGIFHFNFGDCISKSWKQMTTVCFIEIWSGDCYILRKRKFMKYNAKLVTVTVFHEKYIIK